MIWQATVTFLDGSTLVKEGYTKKDVREAVGEYIKGPGCIADLPGGVELIHPCDFGLEGCEPSHPQVEEVRIAPKGI